MGLCKDSLINMTSVYKTGKNNLITDVPGVLVGHVTLRDQEKDIHTGVTAVLPHSGNIFKEKVMAATSVINGFGKSAGLVQIDELGTIETPIIMTNTLSVGTALEALCQHMMKENEDIGVTTGTVNCVVTECNDGKLNDIRGLHVKPEHVFQALESASEVFEEGDVGAGTGMVCMGLKGGLGPAAFQLFYKMITEHTKAEVDQEHIKMIILSDTEIPDRTKAILSGDYDKVYKCILEDAQFLEKSGCEAIVVTCNTAHYFCDMVQEKISIPFINMVELTAKQVAASNPGGKIGIMATEGTIQAGIYQKALEREGLETYVASEPIQKEIMHQIYGRIKSGKRYDFKRWKKIEREYQEAGCNRVILACTELSIVKADEKLNDWYIDAMTVLAKNVVEFAGKRWV